MEKENKPKNKTAEKTVGTAAKKSPAKKTAQKPATAAKSEKSTAKKSPAVATEKNEKAGENIKKPAPSKTKKADTAKKAVKAAPAPETQAQPAKEEVKADARIKVLFVTAEAFPFAGTGGLGEVAGSLPKALNGVGADVRVIMPLYGSIAGKYREKMTFVSYIRVAVGWRNQYCGLLKLENDGVITYFIDNEYYFKRDTVYGQFDDGERFSFFARAVLEVLPLLDFKPDIIHSNDHATALVPFYYATEYYNAYGYSGIKNVFTIHNLEYQGCYPPFILGDVFGIDEKNRGLIDFDNRLNCIKGAIETADCVTTVSPTYAREILIPDRSCGLSGILERNKQKLYGILNGINVEEYNPETSPSIAANYSVDDLSGKGECRLALKRELGLPETGRPTIAVISRLATHKGLDLVKGLLERGGGAFNDCDLVVLGTGEKYLEDFFVYCAYTRGNVRAMITYDKNLAQRIYAGADMFLMPSGAEPCGLSQMMACRYGTVPIVRKTGGLADSIRDCRAGDNVGNGFVFEPYTVEALDETVRAAVGRYYSPAWQPLMERAMRCDFSWNVSAEEYMKLYEKVLGK